MRGVEGARLAEGAALVAILLLAAGLRFGWLGINSFAGDEARISLDALRLTHGEWVAIAQPSSTGIPFLPASVWMFAPPFLLTSDPQGATLYVCLLSWLSVLGVWALARRWGAAAALCAALFMAASPFAVFYGRSIWQPNLLPFLSLAWAWTALRALETDSSHTRFSLATASQVFLGGFILQVHFAGAALALGTVFFFIYGRWWRQWRAVAAGLLLAAACTVPYAYYLLTQAPEVLARFSEVGGGAAVIDLAALGNLLRLALGYDWGPLALGNADPFSRLLPTVIGAGLLLAAGLAALYPRLRAREPLPVVIGVWLFVSPLFFLRHTTPVLPHYQLVALPALALLVGMAAALIRSWLWRWSVGGVVLSLAAAWTFQAAVSLDRAGSERPPQSALSSILSESRSAAAAIPSDRPALVYLHGDDPALSGEVAAFRVLLWDHPDVRLVDGAAILILPNGRATQFSTLAPFQAWEELIDLGLAASVIGFPRRPPGEAYVLTTSDPSVEPPSPWPEGAPLSLANGATLESIRARRVGDRLRISTLWHAGNIVGDVIQQYHHLYRVSDDAELGLRQTPTDLGPPDWVSDVPVRLGQWRTGERIIVMADYLDIVPGRYAVVVGQYALSDGQRVPAADGSAGSRMLVFRWP